MEISESFGAPDFEPGARPQGPIDLYIGVPNAVRIQQHPLAPPVYPRPGYYRHYNGPTLRIEFQVPPSAFEKARRVWLKTPEAQVRRYRELLETLAEQLRPRFPGPGIPLTPYDPEVLRRARAFAQQVFTQDEFRRLEEDKEVAIPSPLHQGVIYVLRKHRILLRYEGGRPEGHYCVHPANMPPTLEENAIFALYIKSGEESKLLRAAHRSEVQQW